jgi:hypothetical protein
VLRESGSITVETLCHKPEVRDSRPDGVKVHPLPLIHLILPAALGPGVYSACSKNKHHKQKNNVSGE